MAKIVLKDFDEALATMNEATGMGAVRLGFRFIKSLPGTQVHITLVWLLAKEVKGERPISLLTMLYRIWSRTRKHFAAEWCGAEAGFWDDAVRGSSPLQAALRRLVADELTQHTDNQEARAASFEVESFCDSISLSRVARIGLKVAALLTYAGVRFLTAGYAAVSAKESSSTVAWSQDALRATTLRGWRSTTSC